MAHLVVYHARRYAFISTLPFEGKMYKGEVYTCNTLYIRNMLMLQLASMSRRCRRRSSERLGLDLCFCVSIWLDEAHRRL